VISNGTILATRRSENQACGSDWRTVPQTAFSSQKIEIHLGKRTSLVDVSVNIQDDPAEDKQSKDNDSHRWDSEIMR
jgi:hypothetical protein